MVKLRDLSRWPLSSQGGLQAGIIIISYHNRSCPCIGSRQQTPRQLSPSGTIRCHCCCVSRIKASPSYERVTLAFLSRPWSANRSTSFRRSLEYLLDQSLCCHTFRWKRG